MQHAGDWTSGLAHLSSLDDATRLRLRELSRPVSAPAGARLFSEGSSCSAYLILLAGEVRVQKVGENGREIVLYRIAPGDICIVTTACLMSGLDYDAEGVAETDIEAQALPVAGFRELLALSASFREFVFKTYGTRVSTLLLLIEEVAFGRIDQRLASCLLRRARGGAEVEATHQELAMELGTAREVVSRQLKEFERRRWTASGRGRVMLLNCAALGAFSTLQTQLGD